MSLTYVRPQSIQESFALVEADQPHVGINFTFSFLHFLFTECGDFG